MWSAHHGRRKHDKVKAACNEPFSPLWPHTGEPLKGVRRAQRCTERRGFVRLYFSRCRGCQHTLRVRISEIRQHEPHSTLQKVPRRATKECGIDNKRAIDVDSANYNPRARVLERWTAWVKIRQHEPKRQSSRVKTLARSRYGRLHGRTAPEACLLHPLGSTPICWPGWRWHA